MSTRDPRVDAYIAKSADFARPILRHLRAAIHAGCPAIEETMKWSFPHFMHKGIVCSMAAFKQHCAFGFWKGSLVVDAASRSDDAMGQLGRITSLDDLPPRRTLLAWVRRAAELNDKGIQPPGRLKSKSEKKVLKVPAAFLAALKKNRKALATFEAFPYSKKKDYVEWCTEAKTDETRQRRLATSIAWLAEGKSRNWKYERC